MSTPSTATATHPASHHTQRYGYPHPQSYQPTASYPSSSAAASARLAPSSYPYALNPPTTSLPFAQSPKIAPPPSATPATMASAQNGISAGVTPTQNGKRKNPDWNEFYKNGIPKEVIVIDDSPPPDHQPKASSHNLATTSSAVPTPNGSMMNPAGKKRRTGLETAYDVGYYDRPSYSIPQHYGEGSSAPSISTDRTTSLHTTAPTSMGSQGSSGTSNGVYYEDTNIGQKRKRVTTRKSARDEQKRRELETAGDAFLSYVPPPNPPIKAKDVAVPVVRDVSNVLYS